MSQGGVVVEFHSVDFFPERWFDIVLVLRTETRELFDRLTARGYSSKKVEENITAEIMQVWTLRTASRISAVAVDPHSYDASY